METLVQRLPATWYESGAFVPDFLMLKGKQYLPVADRVEWFLGDMHHILRNHPDDMRGDSPTFSFSILNEEVSPDSAWFIVRVMDSLGNHADGFGSETKSDFPDFGEKAQTKAIGRALALLGYGTNSAQEFSETTPSGDVRIVDSPRPVKSNPATMDCATPAQASLVKKMYPDMDISELSKQRASELIASKAHTPKSA